MRKFVDPRRIFLKVERRNLWNQDFVPKHALGEKGFSLLELMVVLLVIGMVLAFTFPKFQNLLGGDIKSVTRKLVGTIQYLYDESSMKRKVYRLNFDLNDQKYWASALQETGEITRVETPVLPEKSLPKGVRIEDVVVLRAGKVNQGKIYTEFYPIGEVEKTAIHLLDDGGERITLEINPLTGRVRIHEGFRDFFEG